MKIIVIAFLLILNFNPAQISSAAKGANSSLSFDGNDDYGGFANPIDLSAKDKASFSVWIKVNNDMPTGHQDIFRQDKNGNPDFYIGFDGRGVFEFALKADGYKELEVAAGSFSEWKDWVHIVGTYDGATQKLYKNTTLIGTRSMTGKVGFDSDKPFVLGCSAHGGALNSFFDGLIDEFAIWDDDLTEAEIFSLYNSGKGLSASANSGNYSSSDNLVGYWPMNEGEGNIIDDVSDNNNYITIEGTTWVENEKKEVPINTKPSSFKWVDTSKDTVNITKENLAKEYKFEWTASVDPDGDKLKYQLYAKVGSSARRMINESLEGTSFSTNYQDFLGAAFESFPIVNAVTAVFDMTVLDVKDPQSTFTLKFNGDTRQYVTLPEISSHLGSPNSNTSISLWFKNDGTNDGVIINSSIFNSLFFGRIETKGINLYVYHRSPDEKDEMISASAYKLNQWNHVVLVIGQEPGLVKLYINGNLDDNTISYNKANSYYDANRVWMIGHVKDANDGHQFKGEIDEISIWSDTLKSSEVLQLYNNGKGLIASSLRGEGGIGDSLKAYYPINVDFTTTLKDLTSNNKDGVITGNLLGFKTDYVSMTGDKKVIYIRRYEYLSTVDDQIPATFALHENYPNPFNPVTTLRFDLPEVSDVNVVIYNMLGQKVRTFNMNSISAGSHSIKWNATNDLGDPVGAGVYLYQLQAKDFMKTRKMILLK